MAQGADDPPVSSSQHGEMAGAALASNALDEFNRGAIATEFQLVKE
jgi:hypothetical protein